MCVPARAAAVQLVSGLDLSWDLKHTTSQAPAPPTWLPSARVTQLEKRRRAAS